MAEMAAIIGGKSGIPHGCRNSSVDSAQRHARLQGGKACFERFMQRVVDLAFCPTRTAQDSGTAAIGTVAVDNTTNINLDEIACLCRASRCKAIPADCNIGPC